MVLIIDFNPRGPCGPRHLVYRVFSHFWNFNPRGPCGPRRPWHSSSPGGSDISILAVLADRDRRRSAPASERSRFQSSRSLRTASGLLDNLIDINRFQSSRSLRTATFIHCAFASFNSTFQSSRSLRTATMSAMTSKTRSPYFNPRGPCGPRPAPPAICTPSWAYFNPRGPCGPRRYAVNAQFLGSDISILAVLADRDRQT